MWEPGDLVELTTERFLIRSMTREDATEELIGWLADPDVATGMNMPAKRMTRVQAVNWVLHQDNLRDFRLLVVDRESGTGIGFFTISVEPAQKTAETAVVIGDQTRWGQNIVVEVRTALLEFLFDTMGMHKVIGRPHGRNVSSIFNYKALGFTCEAVLREQMRAVDGGGRLDQLIFGLLASEWRARANGTGGDGS
jgi:RimJ/RimL family protein N-acetyltransferase